MVCREHCSDIQYLLCAADVWNGYSNHSGMTRIQWYDIADHHVQIRCHKHDDNNRVGLSEMEKVIAQRRKG